MIQGIKGIELFVCLMVFNATFIRLDVYNGRVTLYVGRVWRYQRGYQNPYIEEQTTQYPKQKVQKDKQQSTKHTHKTKDQVTLTPLKTGGELTCSRRVSSYSSTSCTSHVNLVTNSVTNHDWGKGSVYDKWNISVVICDTDIP